MIEPLGTYSVIPKVRSVSTSKIEGTVKLRLAIKEIPEPITLLQTTGEWA